MVSKVYIKRTHSGVSQRSFLKLDKTGQSCSRVAQWAGDSPLTWHTDNAASTGFTISSSDDEVLWLQTSFPDIWSNLLEYADPDTPYLLYSDFAEVCWSAVTMRS